MNRDYSMQEMYGLFPDNLCVHGFNKLTCYPCTPLPNKGGKMDRETEQLLIELAVVLPQFANELPEDMGDNLFAWVDRIEDLLSRKTK